MHEYSKRVFEFSSSPKIKNDDQFINRDLNFERPTSHLCYSEIENLFFCRKNLIPSPVLPAVFINKTAYVALGQSTNKRKKKDSEDKSTGKFEYDKKIQIDLSKYIYIFLEKAIETGVYDSNDKWGKRRQ